MSALTPCSALEPCVICGGHPSLPKGQGRRCYGFRTPDGYAHCTREEYAGQLDYHKGGNAFAHRVDGDCRCGLRHGDAAPIEAVRSARQVKAESPRLWNIPDAHIEMVHRYMLRGRLQFEIARLWKHHRAQYGGRPTFPRHRGADGALYWGIGSKWKGNTKRPLYRQEEALAALSHGLRIFIVEGERDVDAMVAAGFEATCSPFGACKFTKPQARRILRAMRSNPEASVVIIADDDQAGLKHAQQVYRLITPTRDVRARVTSQLPPDDYHDMAEAIASHKESLDAGQ